MANNAYQILLEQLILILPNNRLVKFLQKHYRTGNNASADSIIQHILDLHFNSLFDPFNDLYCDSDYKYVNEVVGEIKWDRVYGGISFNSRDKYDLRINRVIFNSFRGFPSSKDGNKHSYGITFESDKQRNPSSAIILGRNGVGKSSIYQGIEYVYRGTIGEVELRSYGSRNNSFSDRIDKYMKHWNSSQSEFQIETVYNEVDGGVYSINSPIYKHSAIFNNFTSPYFFISENSLIHSGQMHFEHGGKNSLRMMVADALGMNELCWLSRLLYRIAIYRGETLSLTLDAKQIESIKETLQSNELEMAKLKYYFSNYNYIEQIKDKDDYLALFNKIYEVDYTSVYRDKFIDILACLSIIYHIKVAEVYPIIELTGAPVSIGKNNSRKVSEAFRQLNVLMKSLDDLDHKCDVYLEHLKNYDVLSSYYLCLYDIRQLSTNFKKEFTDYGLYDISSEYARIEDVDIDIDTYRVHYKLISEFENKADYIVQRLKDSNSQEIVAELKTNKYENLVDYCELTPKEAFNIVYKLQSLINEQKDELKKYTDAMSRIQLIKRIQDEAFYAFTLIRDEISSRFYKEVNDLHNEIIYKVMRDFLNPGEKLVWREDKFDIDIHEDGYVPSVQEGQYLSCWIESTKGAITVKKHFNTFRFHLFNTILNIAFALIFSKKNNVSMPIVLDDIFYSCDFQNRLNIRKFIKNILSVIADHSTDIQLIVFTHDELVFRAIMDQIKENKSDNNSGFMFYMLLPTSEASYSCLHKFNDIAIELS